MTYQVPRSRLGGIGNFAEIVEVYARDLADWTERKSLLEAGADPESVHLYPAPHAPEIVQLCVGADGKPDFEIIEDVAPAAHPTRRRRDVMLDVVRQAQAAAAAKIISPGKLALAQLDYADAQDRINRNLGTDDDLSISISHEETQAALKALARRAAVAQAAIEDLADDALDSWACPNLEVSP